MKQIILLLIYVLVACSCNKQNQSTEQIGSFVYIGDTAIIVGKTPDNYIYLFKKTNTLKQGAYFDYVTRQDLGFSSRDLKDLHPGELFVHEASNTINLVKSIIKRNKNFVIKTSSIDVINDNKIDCRKLDDVYILPLDDTTNLYVPIFGKTEEQQDYSHVRLLRRENKVFVLNDSTNELLKILYNFK